MNLWEQLIDTINAHGGRDELDDAILQAAYLFEKARLAPEPEAARELAAQYGWPPKVVAEPVDSSARARLVESLERLALARPDDPAVGSVYWALGKVGDAALRDFFVEGLKQQLNRSSDALFQILIALDRLGEPVFGERSSRSIEQVAQNEASAEAYLATLED